MGGTHRTFGALSLYLLFSSIFRNSLFTITIIILFTYHSQQSVDQLILLIYLYSHFPRIVCINKTLEI